MLRKFPPQTSYSKPNQPMHPMGHPTHMGMMNQMGMMGQFPQPMGNMPMNQQIDLSKMDTNTKREYLGESLYSKISSSPIFANIHE